MHCLRVAGIGEELSNLLGVRVDVVAEALLHESAVGDDPRGPRGAVTRNREERFGETSWPPSSVLSGTVPIWLTLTIASMACDAVLRALAVIGEAVRQW